MNPSNGKTTRTHGYAPVNGLKMYYEIEGAGDPLVYIPPLFGYAGANSFPSLRRNRQIITMDLQGHGRAADLPDRAITFEQHAKDVVGLLEYLEIEQANFVGESLGGITATLIALRHPSLVKRLVTYGTMFGKPQDCVRPELLATTGRPFGKKFLVSNGMDFQKTNFLPWRSSRRNEVGVCRNEALLFSFSGE